MSRLFPEFAVLPSALRPEQFDDPSHLPIYIDAVLKNRLRRSGFLRDIRNGGWRREALDAARGSIPMAKFLQWLVMNKRLLPMRDMACVDWTEEVLAGHQVRRLNGVVADTEAASRFSDIPSSTIDRVGDAIWWEERVSLRQARSVPQIADELRPLLQHGRHLVFVDPFIDPIYFRAFAPYLEIVKRNPHRPEIEIHTSAKCSDGQHGLDQMDGEFRKRHLSAKFCVWDGRKKPKGMHDRHLLSDIGGCTLGAGFDNNPRVIQTISVLEPDDRISLLKEYDSSPNVAVGLVRWVLIGRSA